MKEEYFMRVAIPETTVEAVKETLSEIEELLGVEAVKEDKYAISMSGGMMTGYLPLFPWRGEIPGVGYFACFSLDVGTLVTSGDWGEKRKELRDILKEKISEEIRIPVIHRITGTDLTLGFELVREGKKPPHTDSTVREIIDDEYRFCAGEHGEKILTETYFGS